MTDVFSFFDFFNHHTNTTTIDIIIDQLIFYEMCDTTRS